jgi:hypothetical protein
MVYVIGFIVIFKVEQTCLVVYPVMIFHNLSQSPFLRYRLYNWLLDEEGYIGCCYDLWYSLFHGLLYCLGLLSFLFCCLLFLILLLIV